MNQANQNHNSPGRIFFKIGASVAVVALILSISRLFLTTSDRQATTFYNYDLSNSSQMGAFLSVIGISILLIIIGSYLLKEYDIIGTPFIVGGLFSLILVTFLVYIFQNYAGFFGGYGSHSKAVDPLAQLVLTTVMAIEWIMLIFYAWRSYPAEGIKKEEPDILPPPQNLPPSNQVPPKINPGASK